ncbi:MAG: TolC family protein [Betaproteobacteria bacterium]|nr:TolC family protein [Betaproteobacteria bacterium]NBT10759.1 TolC family protein [Betaproteobacteria bacterium]NBU49497.1 TolC family protein [Betaproteobacteria bacterium]
MLLYPISHHIEPRAWAPVGRSLVVMGILGWCSLGGAMAVTAAPGPCPVPPPAAGVPLSLQGALQRSDCHPLVRTAQGLLRGARADEITAGQRPNPNLTVGAYSVPRSGLGAGGFMDKAFDHQVRLDQLLERGGKRVLRQQAAAGQAQSATAELAQARADARADIAAAYLDLQAAVARMQALSVLVEGSAQALRLLDARVRAGDAPAIESARLRAEHARLQADEAQAQAETAAWRARLAVALGLEQGLPALQNAEDWTPAAGLDIATPTEQLLARRPDVQAARARSLAAERLHQLAQAQRTRDVTIGLQADRYPANLTNPSGNGNTVSFTASVPLFLGHAYEGEIARAMADWQQAQDQESLVREAARALIDQSRSGLLSARSRERLARDELLPAAERLAAAAEAAWQRGGSSLLELIEARRALRAARLEALTARAEAAKAAWRWQSLDTPAP